MDGSSGVVVFDGFGGRGEGESAGGGGVDIWVAVEGRVRE